MKGRVTVNIDLEEDPNKVLLRIYAQKDPEAYVEFPYDPEEARELAQALITAAGVAEPGMDLGVDHGKPN